MKSAGINYLMLLRVMGLLVMIEAAFMLVPLVTAVIYDDGDLMAFVVSITLTALTGALMTFGFKPRRRDMGRGGVFCFRYDTVHDMPVAIDAIRRFF